MKTVFVVGLFAFFGQNVRHFPGERFMSLTLLVLLFLAWLFFGYFAYGNLLA